MFEIGIFCVIVLAVGYWLALWLMGRHDDVLHGDFVQTEQGPGSAPARSQATPFAPAFSSPAASLPPASSPPAALPQMRPDRSDSLQSLLTAIKRDLKDAAQI